MRVQTKDLCQIRSYTDYYHLENKNLQDKVLFGCNTIAPFVSYWCNCNQ